MGGEGGGGVEGLVWIATSGVDTLVCDSNNSRSLVFFFLWSTMASGMSDVSWLLLS